MTRVCFTICSIISAELPNLFRKHIKQQTERLHPSTQWQTKPTANWGRVALICRWACRASSHTCEHSGRHFRLPVHLSACQQEVPFISKQANTIFIHKSKEQTSELAGYVFQLSIPKKARLYAWQTSQARTSVQNIVWNCHQLHAIKLDTGMAHATWRHIGQRVYRCMTALSN